MLGRTLVVAAALSAWLALLGIWVPTLDVLASFLPVIGAALLVGVILSGRPYRWLFPLAAFAAAPVAFATTHEAMRAIPAATATDRSLRILTHNVWVDNATPAATGAAIAAAAPDIALLQETTRSRPLLLAAAAGVLPYSTRCPRGGCGLTILSRWPIRASGYFLKDAHGRAFGPPILWATIAVPGAPPVTVATLHYPWPLPAARAASARAAMAHALARIDRNALILGGDMNLTPWSAAMRQQDTAFAPLIRMTRAAWSWPSGFAFLPIDQLYAGPAWGVIGVRRLAAAGSDHLPLLVTLGRR